jgi:predicted enzyme related to lactoylglutathione lyase
MSSVQAGSGDTDSAPGDAVVDMRLEVVVIPVSDVDRAKGFYGQLGWRLDADVAPDDEVRLVQFTSPGSGCSIQFGRSLTSAAPGSAQGLYLIVSDVGAARAELVSHGAEVSEVSRRRPRARSS